MNNQQVEKHLKQLVHQLRRGDQVGLFAKASKLVKMAPKNPRVHDFFGVVNATLGRHKEAIDAHEAALKILPHDPDIRMRYAQALQRGGRYEEAILAYERVLYAKSRDFKALRGKASALTDMGRLEDARATLDEIEKTLKKKSPTPSVLLAIATSYARLSPDAVDPQEILDRITPLANDESCEANLRINAYFQMGRLHEKLKHYDDAFSCWANTKTLKHLKWDPDEHSRRVDKLIECWSADCAVPDSGIDGSRLIYICGMMRSGTSLTEQMIAQGEGVTPGGEMNAVSRRVSETEQERSPMFRPLPYSRAKYTQPTMTKITKLAWQMYNEVSQKSIITDKQPFNCFFIPLTVRMFPGCKVIHCMRDAQDCCLSNFMQSFSRPHPQTNELYWLGRYFRDYERMMDAWRSVAGESIIDLRYEDLVADPEGQSKRVMGFLGLPWTQDILNFHNSDRTVRTASREQVRKPIYKSSVKKHELYREHLADLRRGLGIDPEPAARP